MRERAVTTSVIWIALAVSTGLILNSVRYTELVQSPIDPTQLIAQTAFAATPWQIGAGILIFMLICCAMGATIAIWQGANNSANSQAVQQAEKTKRDNRDARIKHLLASMDDDDLDLLERGGVDPEGERLSLEALLRKRD